MIKITYGDAVYIRNILKDHIRDEMQKSTYGKCNGEKYFSFCKESYKGDSHLDTCNEILAKIDYQMKYKN